MKILFVEKRLRMEKLGILYLAAMLKKAGHKVDLVQDDIENADEYLTKNPADFVMYSICSDEADWFTKRNRKLKTNHRFISVVGGPDPTFMPSRWLKDETVDFIVQGPGESVILNIVNGSAPRLSRGSLLGTFEYFSPDRSIAYKYDEFGKARMKRFIAGRYCDLSCSHCHNSAFKKIFRDQQSCFGFRPAPEKMLEEIIGVKEEYGLKLACFDDDNLAGDSNWIRKFCDLLINAGKPVDFYGLIRANSFTQEMVKMLARANCKLLDIALESANPKTQKLLRRGAITNEKVYQAVRWCEEAGIKVRLMNMIGLPVEDPLGDALETFEFNKKCDSTSSTASIYQPLPGTVLWAYCIQKGFIRADIQPAGYYDRTVLQIKEASEINQLGKYWYQAFKEKWSVEYLKERLKKPMSDEEMTLMSQQALARHKKEFFELDDCKKEL